MSWDLTEGVKGPAKEPGCWYRTGPDAEAFAAAYFNLLTKANTKRSPEPCANSWGAQWCSTSWHLYCQMVAQSPLDSLGDPSIWFADERRLRGFLTRGTSLVSWCRCILACQAAAARTTAHHHQQHQPSHPRELVRQLGISPSQAWRSSVE